MNCEDAKTLMPESWNGTLDEADRLILDQHLERCAACRAETDQLKRLWVSLGELPGETPGDHLRGRFYDRLDAYRQGAAERVNVKEMPPPGVRMPGRYWGAGIGIAAALVVGFFTGSMFDSRKDNTQLSHLRAEVNNMRQLVALSLLQQQNASDRLQGVNWSYRVERSDTEVLSALLHTINNDTNVNVRLAAIDAMRTFAESGVARRGLVQAIPRQTSPMVQIALIDQLVDLKEAGAKPSLTTLAKDDAVNPAVRERAQWALGRLQ